jgi:alpha-1,3-mannosyltransferase
MRVLHVVRQFHPAVGGIEAVVRSLSSQQRSVGIDAEVLTLNRKFCDSKETLPRCSIVNGVPVSRIGYFGSRRYPIAPSVFGRLKSYDLIHVHGVDFFSDYLALTAPVHGKPLVLSTHGGFFHTDFARALKRIYFNTVTRAALKQYSSVVACSAADVETFRPVAGPRLKLIDNGVDTAKFARASSTEFKPSLVYFGRFAAHKGLAHLVETFEVLRKRVPEARLHLIGTDWDGTMERLQLTHAGELKAGQVDVKTDVSDEDIVRTLKECSFFVSASEYEGFGLTLVEALSAGLVPIVSRIPSFEVIIAGAGVGHVVDFNDPKRAGHETAELVNSCIERHGELRSAAMNSAQRFGWEGVEGRFRAVYENVLGLKRRTILGVRFEPMNRAQAVRRIDNELDSGRRLRVAFANAHTLNLATRNAAFRYALLTRFLVLNDGVGIDIASRWKFGSNFPDNLNGTDFVPHFLGTTRHRLRIFLVGSQPKVVSEAARRFAVTWPRHRIVGTCDGFFRDEAQIEELCKKIREAEADVLLVGLGNPMQELWITKYGPTTGAKLQIGVGALFDFTSGEIPRAPMWMRRLRCEWTYRLAREPRRLFSRYVVGNVIFLGHALGDRRAGLAP